MEEYTSEINKLLRIGEMQVMPHSDVKKAAGVEPVQELTPGQVPFDLPVVDLAQEQTQSVADQVMSNILGNSQTPSKQALPVAANQTQISVEAVDGNDYQVYKKSVEAKSPAPTPKTWKQFVRSLVLYPAIFVVAFAFFYVMFNFSALVSQVSAWFDKPEDEQILQEDLTAYYDWMSGYYFAVSDSELLKPAHDIDKDGLTNLDEFIMRTNPTVADSDSDGNSDGIEVINNYNPWGQGRMTKTQTELREQLNIVLINNRINFNAGSGLGSSAVNDNGVVFDQSINGRLSIPKLNMQVPLVWTQNPDDFERDLSRGVVHYPGTAFPGQLGTMYVSGHSSGFFWERNPYYSIFTKINTLSPGDDIFVEVTSTDGELFTYRYQVYEENIYKPDDQAQFIDNSMAKLNLSTCWPIGTDRDRYVVSAQLVDL